MNKLLIVDDEETNILALTEILGSDYELYTAANGFSAIEIADSILPDLILLDILMPEMDGFEVINTLKKTERTREIPVVFITGYTNAENMDLGLTYGAVDCIGKPFIPAIIKHRVQNYVQMINYFHEIQAIREKSREAEDAKKTSGILVNMLNTIDAMIYATVPGTGEILFANDTMKKHYGVGGDCVGRLCYQIFQKGMTERCPFCPCHQLDKEPDKPVVWTEQSTLTGRIYRNTDSYIEWPGGEMAHLQHSVDVTELINAKEEAIQANKAKNKFLATMSHEIRTPMNAILGITEIQLYNEDLSPMVQESLIKIHDAGYTLLHIINDMLDLSKIEAGRMNVKPVKYDVPSLINDSVHLNIMRLGSKPIDFRLEVDENIPAELYGDDLRIKQILNNLLSNAFKYTERGVVELSVSAESFPGGGDWELILRVSDTGQGMTQEQISKLFDEYTQFSIENGRLIEGVGLGMHIVKRLVTMMNGKIQVDSEPGAGTAFIIRLPQGDTGAEKIGKEMATHLQEFSFHGKSLIKGAEILRDYMPYGSVLIVDDVDTNLYVAKGFLVPYGLTIDTAISGFEAIDKVKGGNEYDVVFMDHMMPKMDGIETTKKMREIGYTRPIVALTANALVGRAEMFLASGFDDFISKPIDIRQLNASLNRLIRDKQTPETLEAARRLKEEKYAAINSLAADPDARQLAETFVKDAEKAVATLEMIHKNGYRRGDDVQLFITTVHAMKSALGHVGETELSRLALELENAGNMGDIALIMAETPPFLSALLAVIDKNRFKDDTDDTEDGDMAYLREQLLIIRTACEAYDRKAAKNALNELKQKTWLRTTKERLETISEHLLHGYFEEAAAEAEDQIKALPKK